MFFKFGFKHKTVNGLRKKQGLTAKELAQQINVDTVKILKIDNLKIKDVLENLKKKITPILRGDNIDKIPWI